jgi:serine/threonine protein kinase
MLVRAKEHDPVGMHSDREIAIDEHLKNNPVEHDGDELVRRVVDSFEVASLKGNHKCILYQPLGMSFSNFLKLFPQNRFPKELAQRSIQLLLIAIDYLHQCNIVHTGKFSVFLVIRS